MRQAVLVKTGIPFVWVTHDHEQVARLAGVGDAVGNAVYTIV